MFHHPYYPEPFYYHGCTTLYPIVEVEDDIDDGFDEENFYQEGETVSSSRSCFGDEWTLIFRKGNSDEDVVDVNSRTRSISIRTRTTTATSGSGIVAGNSSPGGGSVNSDSKNGNNLNLTSSLSSSPESCSVTTGSRAPSLCLSTAASTPPTTAGARRSSRPRRRRRWQHRNCKGCHPIVSKHCRSKNLAMTAADFSPLLNHLKRGAAAVASASSVGGAGGDHPADGVGAGSDCCDENHTDRYTAGSQRYKQ